MYYAQGSFYAHGSSLSLSLLLVLLLWSFYYVYKVNRAVRTTSFIRFLNFLIFFISVYGIYNIFTQVDFVESGDGYENSYSQLRDWYKGLLPIYAYYYFSYKGTVNKEWFTRWIFVFTATAIVQYFVYQKDQLTMILEMGSRQTEITNNTGYIIVSLLPAIVFVEKKWLQYMLVAIVIIFSLSAMKRGALLVGSMALVVFFYNTFKNSSTKDKFFLLMGLAVVSTMAIYYVGYMMESSSYFIDRLDATKSGESGRNFTYIYNKYIEQDSLIYILFGRGIMGTLELMQIRAHNDWLEFLINFGIVGLLVFGIFWKKMWSDICKIDKNTEIWVAALVFFTINFLKTFFSMSLGTLTIYSSAVFAYCITYLIKGEFNYGNKK